jgi:hypothetical protein
METANAFIYPAFKGYVFHVFNCGVERVFGSESHPKFTMGNHRECPPVDDRGH